jgi:DNA-directed RNA polymerase specialized sigma24 family protein
MAALDCTQSARRRGPSRPRRRRRTPASGHGRIEVTDEDLDAIDGHVAVSIDAALDRLPVAQRDAVRRRVLLDEAYADIARQSGCSEQVARQRVRRGLQALRSIIEET